MNRMKNRAPLLVVAAGVCWGLMGLFLAPLREAGVSALQIAGLRCLTAGGGMTLFLLVVDRQRLKVRVRDLWMFLGTGVFSFALFNVCYLLCMEWSTLSVACTLLYTGPSFVMLLSCLLFWERFTLRKGVAVCLALLGCGAVTGVFQGQEGLSGLALAVGVCAGFGYALYSIFGRVALERYHGWTVVTYTFWFAALALLPVCGLPEMAGILGEIPNLRVSALLLGLAATLLPFLLYTKGLEGMETGRAAILTSVEPLTASLLSILVLREPFQWNQGLGMALILLAVGVLNHPQKVVMQGKSTVG